MEKTIGRVQVINEWNGQQASQGPQDKKAPYDKDTAHLSAPCFADSTFLNIFHVLLCFMSFHMLFPLPSSSTLFREFLFILQDLPHVSYPFGSTVKCPFCEIPHILNLSVLGLIKFYCIVCVHPFYLAHYEFFEGASSALLISLLPAPNFYKVSRRC